MWKRYLSRLVMLAVVVLVVAVAVAAAYFGVVKPARTDPPELVVEVTPERVARGQYLYTLADCDGCHSPRDYSRFAGPVIEGRRGAGTVLPAELGMPGTIVASNITPDAETGIGAWTDGEKIRAIRDGISRDGRALFPMMPYPLLRHMSDEDVRSLVAYLKTLPPVRNPLPRTKVDFPVSLLIRTAPRPAGTVPDPDRSDPVAYGRYLSNIAGCVDCHTPFEKGRLREDMHFAGGRLFRFPSAEVVSSNITPHPETGIGNWTEEDFLNRFYAYQRYVEKGPPSVGPEGFTLMPWLGLSQLPEDDLKAIYHYLRTQRPIANRVETHPGRAVTGTQVESPTSAN